MSSGVYNNRLLQLTAGTRISYRIAARRATVFLTASRERTFLTARGENAFAAGPHETGLLPTAPATNCLELVAVMPQPKLHRTDFARNLPAHKKQLNPEVRLPV